MNLDLDTYERIWRETNSEFARVRHRFHGSEDKVWNRIFNQKVDAETRKVVGR